MILTLLFIVSFFLPVLMTGCSSKAEGPLRPPETKKVEHYDDYGGTRVADPYRWLEDLDSSETHDWIEAQNKVTFDFLRAIPEREAIRQRLTDLWNYKRYGIPLEVHNRYFFSRNDGLQNQSVIYTSLDLNSEPRILLDPNTLSSDGTVALSDWEISPDAKLMAYGTSSSGSDWQEWRIRSVESAEDQEDILKWIKFSGVSWTPDAKGLYYSRYDEPQEKEAMEGVNYYQKLYYHRLGSPQSEDRLVYERKDQKDWGFNGTVSDDGRYLIIESWQGTDSRNRVFFKDLKEDGRVRELLTDLDASYTFVGNDGPLFWFRTDQGAPRGRLVAIESGNPEPSRRQEIVPEKDKTLESVSVLNNMLVARYLKDAHSEVQILDKNGSLVRELELPGLGSTGGFEGKPSSRETFYSYTSFTTPTAIYRYDLATGQSTLVRKPQVDFDPAEYQTEQVFFTSKDGTRIPMFISHRKGLQLDGNLPTLLYGYGGFNISITPSFSISDLVWMEMGGVYAVANLRGGGEYGEEWHQAGTRLNKQNVFDDFIGAAEWLISNRYTSPRKLAIHGRSNGGLLVGAVMTQRPELFAVALPGVGVMDMLRFNQFTIGWAWESDYGSPQNPEEFKAIYAYSPLHNIQPGTHYPATLITTADHDDRVVPAHSFKFAAALEAAQGGSEPILIRVETRAGHGAGKPTAKLIEEATDMLAFLVKELNFSVVHNPAQAGK